MEPLTLGFQPTVDEVAAATVDLAPAVRLSSRRTKLLGGVALVLGVYALFAAPAVAFGCFLAGVLLFGLGTSFSLRRRMRWVIERTPSFTAPHVLVADPTGVRARTPSSDQWFDWTHYEAVVDAAAGGVALVLRGGTSVRFIPGRAFADAAQRAGWVADVERWRAAPTPRPFPPTS
jgi:hypothetical protein